MDAVVEQPTYHVKTIQINELYILQFRLLSSVFIYIALKIVWRGIGVYIKVFKIQI